MRVAVVSDIHGNLAALDAVMADLQKASPDLIVQGGDLAASGSRPAEVIDVIRDLKWPGVLGNTDEMLWNPEPLAEIGEGSPALQPLRDMLRDVARLTSEAIGAERLKWLQALPLRWSTDGLTVVHAAPDNLWRSPMVGASDEDLIRTYGELGTRVVVYGHIHRPYVRRLPGLVVANSGSVSLPYDGDPRASYALVDDEEITIRRVAYDIAKETTRLQEMRYPHADWLGSVLRSGTYVPPPL